MSGEWRTGVLIPEGGEPAQGGTLFSDTASHSLTNLVPPDMSQAGPYQEGDILYRMWYGNERFSRWTDSQHCLNAELRIRHADRYVNGTFGKAIHVN